MRRLFSGVSRECGERRVRQAIRCGNDVEKDNLNNASRPFSLEGERQGEGDRIFAFSTVFVSV